MDQPLKTWGVSGKRIMTEMYGQDYTLKSNRVEKVFESGHVVIYISDSIWYIKKTKKFECIDHSNDR